MEKLLVALFESVEWLPQPYADFLLLAFMIIALLVALLSVDEIWRFIVRIISGFVDVFYLNQALLRRQNLRDTLVRGGHVKADDFRQMFRLAFFVGLARDITRFRNRGHSESHAIDKALHENMWRLDDKTKALFLIHNDTSIFQRGGR